MTNYEELKLAVYESGLDQEDIEEIVNIMESCDEDELQEVCESVEELLQDVYEASKEEADDIESDGRARRDIKKRDANFRKEHRIKEEIRLLQNNSPALRRDKALDSGKYGSQYERMTPEQKRRQDIRKATSDYFRSGEKKKPADKFQKYLDGRRPSYVPKDQPYTGDRYDRLRKLYDKNEDKYHTFVDTYDNGISDDPKENARIIRKAHKEGKKIVSPSTYNKVNDNYTKAQTSVYNKLHNVGTKSSIMNDMSIKIKKKLKDNQSLTPREQEFKDKYPKLFESACLDLYEAYDNGDITMEERDYYLEHVSELFEEE